jgi:hypothetical protein
MVKLSAHSIVQYPKDLPSHAREVHCDDPTQRGTLWWPNTEYWHFLYSHSTLRQAILYHPLEFWAVRSSELSQIWLDTVRMFPFRKFEYWLFSWMRLAVINLKKAVYVHTNTKLTYKESYSWSGNLLWWVATWLPTTGGMLAISSSSFWWRRLQDQVIFPSWHWVMW